MTKRKSGCVGKLLVGFLLLGVIGVLVPRTPVPPPIPETPQQKVAREARETQGQQAKARQEQAAQQQKQAEQRAKAAADAELDRRTDAFEKWALQNTAVTDIHIEGHLTMFVTLTPDKYTNRDNVRVIAEQLARAYGMQVGVNYVACDVYYGNEVYAKGIFSR